MAASGHAMWHDDVSMMSPQGSALLTSAWAHADVSVECLMGQQSVGPTGPHVSLCVLLTGGPHVSVLKKGKKLKKVTVRMG